MNAKLDDLVSSLIALPDEKWESLTKADWDTLLCRLEWDMDFKELLAQRAQFSCLWEKFDIPDLFRAVRLVPELVPRETWNRLTRLDWLELVGDSAKDFVRYARWCPPSILFEQHGKADAIDRFFFSREGESEYLSNNDDESEYKFERYKRELQEANSKWRARCLVECPPRIVIPVGIDEIASDVFRGCGRLVSVSIPEGVFRIGDGAFEECGNLVEISMPTTIAEIGEAAFCGCAKLASNQIPAGLAVLGDGCFHGCPRDAVSPDAETVNGNAFQPPPLEKANHVDRDSWDDISIYTLMDWDTDSNKQVLSSENIREGMESIPHNAFRGDSSLVRIKIPNSVTNIDAYAFSGCRNLNEIIFGNQLNEIGECAFAKCSSLETIRLPPSLRKIGTLAFFECSNVSSVSIPEGVRTIGDYAFAYCTALKKVSIQASLENIGARVFFGCERLEEVELGIGTKDIWSRAFCGLSRLKRVGIPETISVIGDEAFSGCTSLVSISIPESVKRIGTRAFFDCAGLVSVSIPDGVTTIEDGVFSGCSSLTSINIPDGVTRIGKEAFSGCTSLTEILIPDSVSFVGPDAFWETRNVRRFVLGAGVSSLRGLPRVSRSYEVSERSVSFSSREGVLFSKDGARLLRVPTEFTGTYVVPDGVREIGESAFLGCTALVSVQLPPGLHRIGESAFLGCAALTSVRLPPGLRRIGRQAFEGCVSLRDAPLPTGLEELGNSAFRRCSALSSVFIPESLQKIGTGVFSFCTRLQSVTIDAHHFDYDASLSSFGFLQTVFEGCENLDTVSFTDESAQSAFARADMSVRTFEIRSEKEGWVCYDGIPMFEVENHSDDELETCRTVIRFPRKRTGKYVFPCIPADKGRTRYRLEPEADLDIRRSGLTTVGFGDAYVNSDFSFEMRRGRYSVPEGTEAIGSFSFCHQLTSVEIPEGVETISRNAFEGCWNLVSVKFPKTLRRIEDEAFKNCFRLQAVDIPGKCHVGDRCFENCIRLGTVSLGPKCVVDSFAFEGCKTLQSISAGPNSEGMFPEYALPETIRVNLRNGSGIKDRFGVKYVFVCISTR